MDPLYAFLSIGFLATIAFFAGRVFAFMGVAPHIAYLLVGMLFGAGLPNIERIFLFHCATAFFFAYLGYMASSRQIFSAPLQLLFVHPLRVVIGFALFFPTLYFFGFDMQTSSVIGLLLATSSSLLIRSGRASYSLIERSILSMDALLSGLILIYAMNGADTSAFLIALAYIFLIYFSSGFFSVFVLLVSAFLALQGYVEYPATAFIFGVALSQILDKKSARVKSIVQHFFPLFFLVGFSAWTGLFFIPFSGIYLVVIAFFSLLQNFISLVLLGSLFGVSPKTGAHILARTFGPSEATLFALAFLSAEPSLICAVLWFYIFAFAFSFCVRTEKDAGRLLETLFPKSIFRSLEDREYAYARILLRHHILFSEAYRQQILALARKIITAVVALFIVAFSLDYLVFTPSAPHRGPLILLSLAFLTLILIRLLQWYFRFYEGTLFFISDHAYNGKLRFGKSPYYFVAGFFLTLLGFATIPFFAPVFNLVFLFFALLLVNAGLYLLLSSYANIYQEFVRKRARGDSNPGPAA